MKFENFFLIYHCLGQEFTDVQNVRVELEMIYKREQEVIIFTDADGKTKKYPLDDIAEIVTSRNRYDFRARGTSAEFLDLFRDSNVGAIRSITTKG